MEYDDIADELDHQKFMLEMHKLVESITWRLIDTNLKTLLSFYNDIVVFGDEPAFSSVIAERIWSQNEASR